MNDPKDDYSRDYKCECGHCLGYFPPPWEMEQKP